MRQYIILFFFFTLGGTAFAQLKPVDKDSKVSFSIKNFGFSVSGSFSGLEGEIKFDPEKAEASSFKVSVQANSVNTGNETRDGHLKKEEYFDVKNSPLIEFVSESVKKGSKHDSYQVSGKLTMKKHSKDISIPFTAEKKGNGYLFKGDFKVSRKEFGIGGSSTISDGLTVSLLVVAE